MTRGSITGQVKAISMIVAMLNFIPDRIALSSEKKSAPAPAQLEDSPVRAPAPAPGSVADAPPGPSQSTFTNRVSPGEAPRPTPYVPLFNSVPDLGVGFPTIKNPFVHPR